MVYLTLEALERHTRPGVTTGELSGRGLAFEDRDGWTIRTKDGSLAAHHEHTLVITSGRPVLLTGA